MGRLDGPRTGSAVRGSGELKCKRPNCRRKVNKSGVICQAHYMRELRDKSLRGEYVPGMALVDDALSHIKALHEAGMPYKQMADLAELHPFTIQKMVNGRHKKILANTAAKLLAIELPTSLESRNATGRTSALGVTRRLQALFAAGWPLIRIAEMAGVDRDTVGELARGRPSNTVQVGTARRIDDVFRRLQMQTPEDCTAVRAARSRARNRGWTALPFMWNEDEIDDPAAKPHNPQRGKRVEWIDEYWELRDMGFNDSRIAERLGVQRDSLMARLRKVA